MNQNNSLTPKIDIQNVLFVSDLPSETIDEDLAEFFKNYHFTSAKINKSKTNFYAYVHFENSEYGIKF
jgi:RNA recognition motif-containing protein